MIVACVALFVALGGTGLAATYVVSSNSQVGPNTISGHQPPTGKHANIIGGSVNATDLAPAAATVGKLAPNSVNSSKVVDGSLSAGDIDASSIQQRITGNCSSNEAVQSVTQAGAVNCAAPNGGNADQLDGIDSTGFGALMSAGVEIPPQFGVLDTVSGFVPVSGVTAFTQNQQIAGETSSPSSAMVARDFTVTLSPGPGGDGTDNSVDVELIVNDTGSTFWCSFGGAATTSCTPDPGGTVAIPARSKITLAISVTTGIDEPTPQMHASIGFLMTPN